MLDRYTHNYYCAYCKRHVFGDNPSSLAVGLNTHNTIFHPTLFANWSAAGVVLSAQYSRPRAELADAAISLPQSDAFSVREWGDASTPVITAADRALLAAGLVKW